MGLLVVGLLLFLGAHSMRIVADGWRARVIARIGVPAWRAAYSLVSVAGLLLMIKGYGIARSGGPVLYEAAAWTRPLASALMLPALVLLVAAYVPGTRIKAAIGHPMVVAVKLWAAVHLLANGGAADVLLFGAFLLWAVLDFRAARRRDRAHATSYPAGPVWRDGLAILLGAAIWGAALLGLHARLVGVPLLAV